MATMGQAHRCRLDFPMTATVTPIHRGETSSRARFPMASCPPLPGTFPCHVELDVNSTDLTHKLEDWRSKTAKNVNTAIFTTLHLCEFSCDNQKNYCGRHFPLELQAPKVWSSYDQHRAWEPAGSDSLFSLQDFSKIQKFGEVGILRIALSPRTRVRWAKL